MQIQKRHALCISENGRLTIDFITYIWFKESYSDISHWNKEKIKALFQKIVMSSFFLFIFSTV